MKIKSLDEIPVKYKDLFFQMYNTARSSNNTNEQAKSETKETFIFLLKLFWSRQFNRMSEDHIYFFDWVSDAFLPSESNYDANRLESDLIQHDDPHLLAESCFYSIWIAYENTKNNLYRRKNIFIRIFDIFKK